MKKLSLCILSLSLIAAPSLFAEASVQLDGVHLCCKACVRGVQKAVATVEGATATGDQDAGTVVVTAADKKSLRKAVNAMARGGFYGTPQDASIKMRDISGAKGKKMKSLTITGVHLCCNGCVYAVEDALETVDGVTGNTLEKKVESFQVTGNFNDKEVFAALNKAGFAGKAGK
jgi:copper chaperone CopZ